MPDIQEMRNWLSQQYGGNTSWQATVAEMSDEQVIAVYFRKIETKEYLRRIDEKHTPKKKEEPDEPPTLF
jgi:hypothetical protein